MIYKKIIQVGAFFKKGIDFTDGSIMEIANEGRPIEGKFGTQNVFMVKLLDGKEGNVSFNTTSLNNLIDSFGENSVNWIGKKVKAWAILSNVQGKMIKVYYFLNPATILDESSGEFILPNKVKDIKDSDIPVVQDEEELDIKNIPL